MFVQSRCAGIFAMACAGMTFHAFAASAQPHATARTASIAELLRADGTLDLESGYLGSLDLSGFRMETDPDGTPRFVAERDEESLAAAPESHTENPDDHWSSQFSGLPGTNERVFALAAIGSTLYAGGALSSADGWISGRIAQWDGAAWTPVGEGVSSPDTSARIYAMAVKGSDLYVAGKFVTAGNIPAGGIAKWDGDSWSAVGGGFNAGATAYALAVIGTDLYAGGDFTTAGGTPVGRIAKWNGAAWSGLGSGTNVGSVVRALTAIGTDLYAGGNFTTVDGVSASRVAKWNGAAWSALGTGTDGSTVYALASMDGDLYAGGDFTMAGGNAAGRIARWNGSTWSAVGGGITGARVSSLSAIGGDLYVGGAFTKAGDIAASNIARWSDGTWSAFGAGATGSFSTVDAVAAFGGDVYIAGDFSMAGDVVAENVAKWDGVNWSAAGTEGYGGFANGVLLANGTDLYAGGTAPPVTRQDGIVLNRIGKWDGETWSALGSGVLSHVDAMVFLGDDLYVGGVLTVAGGVPVKNIAKWNGASWSAVGTSGPTATISALAVNGSNLYAAGQRNDLVVFVWKFDGVSWTKIGTVDGLQVIAMAFLGDDLYIAGEFTSVDAVAAVNIARWNGTTWSAVGSGANSLVSTLHVTGSNLYAGGWFTTMDGMPASRIAKWNGSTWSALGAGLTGGTMLGGSVQDISGTDGALYVAGAFANAGGMPANLIAKWDGAAWSNVGSPNALQRYSTSPGTPLGYAVEVVGTDVYVGGAFQVAGYRESVFLARYSNESTGVCGDSVIGDGEDCDDGDTSWSTGEACNELCLALACGDANDSGTITTSDAQFALRASVGTTVCALGVCDVNDNGSVSTSDALAILRYAVGQEVNLGCP